MTFRMSLLLAVGLFAAGCAPGGTLVINGIIPSDGTCVIPKSDPQLGGYLDVSPGGAEFWGSPRIYSLLAGTGNTGDIIVGGTTVMDKGNDRPIVDSFVFTYTSQPKIGKLSTFTMPIAVVLDTTQGSAAITTIGPVNFLSTQVASALDSIDSAGGLLTVSITAKGHMALSNAPMDSEPINFPITLVNTRSVTGACTTLRKGYQCLYPGQGQSIADQGATSSTVCCDGMAGAPGCN